MAETFRTRAAASLPLITFGVVAGVSFLVQPAKFLTPDLTLAQLVSVGSMLFRASHAFQLAMLLVLTFIVLAAKSRSTTAWSLLGVFALVLGVQHFGLMPPLEARLLRLKDGLPLAPSMLHLAYGALEVLKLASLLGLGWLPGATAQRRPSGVMA